MEFQFGGTSVRASSKLFFFFHCLSSNSDRFTKRINANSEKKYFLFPTQTNKKEDWWHANNLASTMENQWPSKNCTRQYQRWKRWPPLLPPPINRRGKAKSITIDSIAMAEAVAIIRMVLAQIVMRPLQPVSINVTFGDWRQPNKIVELSTRAAKIWLHAQKVGHTQKKTYFLFKSFFVLFTG